MGIGITCYLVDVENREYNSITLDGSLDSYYNALDCDCFDIVRRKIGGKYFDIMCDDEGLLKDKPVPSAYDSDGNVAFVGNLLVVKHDKSGNTVSLTNNEIAHIANYVYWVYSEERPVPRPVLTEVDY